MSFWLSLVVFTVSQIPEKSKAQVTPPSQISLGDTIPASARAPLMQAAASLVAGDTGGATLCGDWHGDGWGCPRVSAIFAEKMLRPGTPGFHSSLWTSVFVGVQALLPIFRQNAYVSCIFGWIFVAMSLTQKPLLFQSSAPYFKAWNWYSSSKEGSSEFKISKTIYFSRQKSFS